MPNAWSALLLLPLQCVFNDKDTSSIGAPESCDTSNLTVHVLHFCRELKGFSNAYRMLVEVVLQVLRSIRSSYILDYI